MKKILIKDVSVKDSGYEVIGVADDVNLIQVGEDKIDITNFTEELEPIVITHQCEFYVGEKYDDGTEETENAMKIEFPSVKYVFEILPKDFGGIDEQEFINQQIDVLNDQIVTSQLALRNVTEGALDGIFGAKGVIVN